MTANSFAGLSQQLDNPFVSLAGAYMTAMVVEKAQSSCETVATDLTSEASEHAVFNDFLSACSEYSTATARGSRHSSRYAAWCAERCDETAEVCERMDGAAARACARWCRLLLTELNRELEGVKKTMNSEVSWEGVKTALNKEVKLPWSG